jgi:hypothetical protein
VQPDVLAVRHDAHLIETIEGAANGGAQSGNRLREGDFDEKLFLNDQHP